MTRKHESVGEGSTATDAWGERRGVADEVHGRRARWRRVLERAMPALWMVLGAVLVWSGKASSQVTCSEVLPTPLIAFCPGTPARATDVNHNFRTVAGWIESKVGPVGSSDVTIAGNVAISGSVSVPAGTFSGTELRDDTITSADVQDGTVTLADLNPGVIGTSLTASGSSIGVNPTWLRDQVRSQILVSSEYRATAIGEGAQQIVTGVSTANSVCFVVMSEVGDDNDEDDRTECRVYQAGGNWVVRAWTNSDEAGAAVCTMRCLRW